MGESLKQGVVFVKVMVCRVLRGRQGQQLWLFLGVPGMHFPPHSLLWLPLTSQQQHTWFSPVQISVVFAFPETHNLLFPAVQRDLPQSSPADHLQDLAPSLSWDTLCCFSRASCRYQFTEVWKRWYSRRRDVQTRYLGHGKAQSGVEVGGNTVEQRETASLTSPPSSETNENRADKIRDAVPSCFVVRKVSLRGK